MNQAISSTETSRLMHILSSEQIHYLEAKLDSLSSTYDEHYRERFDHEFLQEFLMQELKQIPVSSEEQTIAKIKHYAELQDYELLAYLGSQGVSLLISDLIEKIAGNSDEINAKQLDTLLDLIDFRNQLFAVEKEALDKGYKKFLQKSLVHSLAK